MIEHPLAIIVHAMRQFSGAEQAVEGMVECLTNVAPWECIEKARQLINEVHKGNTPVYELPEACNKAWPELMHLSSTSGYKQARDHLDEFLDRASRWDWGRTPVGPILRQYMRKFRVSIVDPDVDLCVWGLDENTICEVLNSEDLERLFSSVFDLEIEAMESHGTVTDGLVLPDRGWIPTHAYRDKESGIPIFPTNDQSKDNYQEYLEQRELERQGQMRLPLDSADNFLC